MDEAVLSRIEQKIAEAASHADEIRRLACLLSETEDPGSFALGVMVGRVYNSFYYQSRRILGREPTGEEFKEFLAFLGAKRSAMDVGLR